MTDSKLGRRGVGRESGGILSRVAGKDDGSAVHTGAKASGGDVATGREASLWAVGEPRRALLVPQARPPGGTATNGKNVLNQLEK